MVYVGIDLGGTNIAAGVVDENGKLLNRVSRPTGPERGAEVIVRDMGAAALQAVAEAGFTLDDVAAIGAGVPGIVDPVTGVLPFVTNLGWHQVPFIPWMRQMIDKPIYGDNDATVAALAESVSGVSAEYPNSVFLTLGTGLGGGIILNHRIYSGPRGIASELGHMIIVAGGELCTCGNRGCWERYASATALIRLGKEAAARHGGMLTLLKPEDISARTIEDAARAGDPAALEAFDQFTDYLTFGMVSIINFIDPDIIVVGGGVSGAGDFLLSPVREKLKKHVFYKAMPYARVEKASLGNDAGIIGAAMLGRK